MTAFLTLDSISLATPDGRPLFDGLTLALGRERTGVVGRNGKLAAIVEGSSYAVKQLGDLIAAEMEVH